MTSVPWSDSERQRLRMVVARIIPADDGPGALELGSDAYVFAQLAGDRHADAASIAEGLADLDARAQAEFGRGLDDLDAAQVDDLLVDIEGAGWFALLAELTAEGFYADPGNGGNRDGASWTLIGYEPGLPLSAKVPD